MKRYLTIILLFNLIFGQYNNKYIDPNSLSKIQAQRLEEKLYTNYKEGLLLSRNAEMKARSIKINNREIKFDLKFLVIDLKMDGNYISIFMEVVKQRKMKTIEIGTDIRLYIN